MKVEAAKCNLRYSSCWIVDRIAKYQYFFCWVSGEGSRGERLHRRRRRDRGRGRERNGREVKRKQYYNE
jgi:hypothetical protein